MKGVKTLALVVLALSAVPLFGAPQVIGYLKIDGVQGSSKNPAHFGWFELYTFGFQSSDSPSSHACFSSNVASFMVAGDPTSGSGEAKLRSMCRSRTPVPLMRVDILGSGAGAHMLQNVQFTACKENGDGFSADYEQIRYTQCSAHRRPAPAR